MKKIQAEIIAVGTELLLGQIANTNAQWLSQQLASYGINTFHHTVVGDNINRVEQVLRAAQKRSNVIIVSGGLGPTEDDLTREAFQRLSNFELIEHEPSMKKILNYYDKQQLQMTDNNRKQARIFKGSQVIPNRLGMAPGMIVTYNQTTWIFLPGVPREMKQMVSDDILPYLRKMSGQDMVIQSKLIRVIGIGESRLEHELHHLIQQQTNPTIAMLAQNDGIVIRLTAKEATIKKVNKLLEETKQAIASIIGKHIYGYDDQTIEETIINMLKEQNQQIAVAESLTGGLFTQKLISAPGASSVIPGSIISYDQAVKKDILNVSTETLSLHGTVSRACALEMAQNVMKLLKTDYGMSFTGVAGPGSSEGQPPGTVYIGLYHHSGKEHVEKVLLDGDRNLVRKRAVLKGLEILFKFLKIK